MFTKEQTKLAKPCYEAIKKISKEKWEWEPEVGESCIDKMNNKIRLIVFAGKGEVSWIEEEIDVFQHAHIYTVTPLLHWERIREILKQFGYSLSITSGTSGGQIAIYENVGTDRIYQQPHGNDLQLAVMMAVIELGKGV